MKPESQKTFNELVENLDQMIKVYRQLLNIVRKEREILVSANLDDLNDNNKAKESMLIQAKAIEDQRLLLTEKLAAEEGMADAQPKLLEMAVHIGGPDGDKLRNMHAVLDLLMRRIKEFNGYNESLVNSALQNITGAMKAIKETLQEKPTYQKQGKISSAGGQAGHLVSREA